MTSRRLRPWYAALLGALLVLPALPSAQTPARATPEAVGLSSARLERLGSALQAYVDHGQLAGAVVLVARHGKVAFLRAVGERDRESHDPMRDDTIFRIASQTKAVVSAATLMLQERGALLLSDPVGKYIPEFQKTTVAVPRAGGGYDVVPAKRPVTIRDLLTHTSGLSYGEGPARDRWEAAGIQGWYFADRDEPIAATVARMAALPLDAQPGERWIYGYSIDVLGVVVERASGMPLDRFLRERVFEPLGMKDTHFYLPPADRGRLATVYSATDAGLARAPDRGGMVGQGAYADGPRKSFSGGAGLLSTAADYARFLQMLLNGGELDGARLLSPTTVALMTTNHVGDLYQPNGDGWGYGFSVVRDLGPKTEPTSVGAYSWGGAYHSSYWVDPKEDLVVTYFTQLIPARDVDDQAKVRALVYQAIVSR
jgi:CubicO group peptidase (beta-lactamase class C family)